MQYCITMERTQRIAVWYEANSDDEAITQGEAIFRERVDGDYGFDGGSSEYDFEICHGNGMEIVQWD